MYLVKYNNFLINNSIKFIQALKKSQLLIYYINRRKDIIIYIILICISATPKLYYKDRRKMQLSAANLLAQPISW